VPATRERSASVRSQPQGALPIASVENSTSSPSLSRIFFARPPQISLAAFGKHPGWNDHIDDLGLDTERLIGFKRTLYVDGIAACIESGQWERLDSGLALPGFDHTFVFRAAATAGAVSPSASAAGTERQTGTIGENSGGGGGGGGGVHQIGEFIVGRMWSSEDGKGRSMFPMVVCIHAVNVTLQHALAVALPALQSIHAHCRQTNLASEVVTFLDAQRLKLRTEVARMPLRVAASSRSIRQLADHADLGPQHRGLHRVLYQIEREFTPFLRTGSSPSKSRDNIAPSRQMRVPACGTSPEDVLVSWFGFLDLQIDPSVPIMLILPSGCAWLDILVGEPAGSQMFVLRAGDSAVPLVSTVPYTIDPEFARHAEQVIASGDLTSRSSADRSSDGPHRIAPDTTRFGSRQVVIIIVLSVALAAALWVLLGAAFVPMAQAQSALFQPPASTLAPTFESTSITNAWQEQQAVRARAVAANPQSATEVTSSAKRTESFLMQLDRSLPRSVRRADPVPLWLKGLNDELTLARERRLQRAFRVWGGLIVDTGSPGVTDDLLREAAEITALYKTAAAFTDDMVAVERLLNNGYGLTERPPPTASSVVAPTAERGASIHELVEPWQARLANERAVRATLAPVLDRVEALGNIEVATEADALLEAINVPTNPPTNARPEFALAAWRRLGDRAGILWPATLSELDAEAAIATTLNPIISAIPDATRRRAVQQAFRTGQIRRLARFLALAANPAHIDAGFSRMATFDVRVEDLEPWLQYNHGLHSLRTFAASATGSSADAELRAEIARFVERVQELPSGVSYRADVANTLAALERALDGKDPSKGPAWWATLGPAATGHYKAVLDSPRGERLQFVPSDRTNAEIGRTPLEFALITPDAASGLRPFYLGVNEVSVGMVASIYAASSTDVLSPPAAITRLLPVFEQSEDPRFGPRSWEWDAQRTTVLPARDWLFHLGRAPSDDYSPGTLPARPTLGSPIQQIPPKSAVYLASLAGCRLPTAAEWLAAEAQHPLANLDDANLRDQKWDRHRRHTSDQLAGLRSVYAADAGAFDANGPNPKAARINDDNILWFASADVDDLGITPTTELTRNPVKHLIGNVFEYVLDAPFDPSDPPPADPRDPKAGGYFKRHADQFGVIGGSALSDPMRPPSQRCALRLDDASEGYSDVGFRLAFSGRNIGPDADTLAARVERYLTPTPYLRGK